MNFEEYIVEQLDKVISRYVLEPINDCTKNKLKNDIIMLMIHQHAVTKCDINFKKDDETSPDFEFEIVLTYPDKKTLKIPVKISNRP